MSSSSVIAPIASIKAASSAAPLTLAISLSSSIKDLNNESSAYAMSSNEDNPKDAICSAISSETSKLAVSFAKNSVSSTLTFASASSLLTILSSHPTSLDANLMFWPLEPIAKARLSWLTAISIDLESSSITMDSTLAGTRALITSWAGLSS